MARITKEQKQIFENHVKAWQEDNFTLHPQSSGNLPDFRKRLLSGETSQLLWIKMIDKSVSITSQIAMTTKHLSSAAKASLKKDFRDWLNWMDASCEQILEHSIEFKVIAVSENTNSFGLRQHVVVSKCGLAYKIHLNYLNQMSVGTVFLASCVRDCEVIKSVIFKGAEIPEKIPTPPQDTLKEIWK